MGSLLSSSQPPMASVLLVTTAVSTSFSLSPFTGWLQLYFFLFPLILSLFCFFSLTLLFHLLPSCLSSLFLPSFLWFCHSLRYVVFSHHPSSLTLTSFFLAFSLVTKSGRSQYSSSWVCQEPHCHYHFFGTKWVGQYEYVQLNAVHWWRFIVCFGHVIPMTIPRPHIHVYL